MYPINLRYISLILPEINHKYITLILHEINLKYLRLLVYEIKLIMIRLNCFLDFIKDIFYKGLNTPLFPFPFFLIPHIEKLI